jgi:GGDEF domain-containing protein
VIRATRNGHGPSRITERKRIQEQLEHNASHDVLTNLPNRSLFLDRLQLAALHALRHPESKFAVLFVDVQGLIIVNSTMGHAIVDQLIIDVSTRLKSHLRHYDTVSRSATSAEPLVGREILARMDGY